MYVDFGRQRGRLRFTRKELAAVLALITAAFGYVVRNECAITGLNTKLAQCEQACHRLQTKTADYKPTTTNQGDIK